MTTKSMTKTQVRTIVIAAAGLAIVAAFGFIAINPRARSYFTQPFRPYQILPGYVTPGYTPGYVPGYRR